MGIAQGTVEIHKSPVGPPVHLAPNSRHIGADQPLSDANEY